MRTVPPAGVYFSAFETRLPTICWHREASVTTVASGELTCDSQWTWRVAAIGEFWIRGRRGGSDIHGLIVPVARLRERRGTAGFARLGRPCLAARPTRSGSRRSPSPSRDHDLIREEGVTVGQIEHGLMRQ